MSVKYKKGNQIDPLTEGTMGKMRLNVKGNDIENIWVKRFIGYSVLQNHAVNLFPFESWGLIIPSTAQEFDLIDILMSGEIELHPEAWDEYIKAGIIDETGTYTKINNIKNEEDEHNSPNESQISS